MLNHHVKLSITILIVINYTLMFFYEQEIPIRVPHKNVFISLLRITLPDDIRKLKKSVCFHSKSSLSWGDVKCNCNAGVFRYTKCTARWAGAWPGCPLSAPSPGAAPSARPSPATRPPAQTPARRSRWDSTSPCHLNSRYRRNSLTSPSFFANCCLSFYDAIWNTYGIDFSFANLLTKTFNHGRHLLKENCKGT